MPLGNRRDAKHYQDALSVIEADSSHMERRIGLAKKLYSSPELISIWFLISDGAECFK